MSELTHLKRLIDVAETNSESLSATTPPGYRFRYIDLSAASAGFIDWALVQDTTYRDAPSRARRVVRPGDTLFGTVRPNLQSHGRIADEKSGELVASTGFSVIRARPGLSDPSFLFHTIMSGAVLAQANRLAVGSSYPALNDGDVRNFQIFAPPYEEQRVAGRILDTLDTAIRETEAIIAKLKAIKQGLLHDLLTRGIDANGELRPPQSEAPHLYKQSPLGWIPQEWEVEKLGECADIASGVTLGRTVSGPGTLNLPYLRVANVQDGFIDLSEIKMVRILKSELDRFALKSGDVLMNEGGDFDKLGRGAVWTGEIDPCLHQNHVFRVRCNSSILLPSYLAAFSASTRGKRYFVQASKQTTNLASINSTQLKAFGIALPSIQEQVEIIERLNRFEKMQACEFEMVSQLYRTKAGLMDNLLTGRVRVTPLLTAHADQRSG